MYVLITERMDPTDGPIHEMMTGSKGEMIHYRMRKEAEDKAAEFMREYIKQDDGTFKRKWLYTYVMSPVNCFYQPVEKKETADAESNAESNEHTGT